MRCIRLLIAEDSPVTARLLTAILNTDPEISVVGIAHDGLEAVRMTPTLRPDAILMDIYMPGMDGAEATQQIMASSPTPILIITSLANPQGRGKVFKAMSYGALVAIEKSLFEGNAVDQKVQSEFIAKVKFFSGMRVTRQPIAKFEGRQRVTTAGLEVARATARHKIVGIVASAGGPHALLTILKDLPEQFPAPIVMAQHISPGFLKGFVEWLDSETSQKVTIAENGETLEPGTGYVAPAALHMRVTRAGKIALSDEPAVNGQRPSGTVLLQSIAEAYGERGLGVLLTGMGRDGAAGLQAIHEAKGHTISQDGQSSIIYGMPKAAIELGVVDDIVPLTDMAAAIVRWVSGPSYGIRHF